MTPEEQTTVDAVTAKLAGEIYIGAQVQFKDGIYKVVSRGAMEYVVVHGALRRRQWWRVARERDGYFAVRDEDDLRLRLI